MFFFFRFINDVRAIWKQKRMMIYCNFRQVSHWTHQVVHYQVSPSRTKVCQQIMSKNSSATYHSQVNNNKRLAAPHDALCPRVCAFSLFFVFVVDHSHNFIFLVFFSQSLPPLSALEFSIWC